MRGAEKQHDRARKWRKLRRGARRGRRIVGDDAACYRRRAMGKRFWQHPSVQKAAIWLLRAYLAFALKTTRWRLVGEASTTTILAGAPVIAAFWHEVLPLMPALRWRSAGRLKVLISRHRDGQIIANVVRGLGIEVVHGSNARGAKSRGGAAGLRRLLALLAAGEQVVITPDGPRGPRRRAAPGVAQLAALSGVPIMPCAAMTRPRITLPSWDRMVLPLPFGRGVIVCAETIRVARDGAEAALPAIEAALTAAAEAARRACG